MRLIAEPRAFVRDSLECMADGSLLEELLPHLPQCLASLAALPTCQRLLQCAPVPECTSDGLPRLTLFVDTRTNEEAEDIVPEEVTADDFPAFSEHGAAEESMWLQRVETT